MGMILNEYVVPIIKPVILVVLVAEDVLVDVLLLSIIIL